MVTIMEATRTNGEVRPAAAVNPNAAVSESPRAAIDARGLALLPDDFNATVSICTAEVAVKIIRSAVELVIVRVGHGCESRPGRAVDCWKCQHREQNTNKTEKHLFHLRILRRVTLAGVVARYRVKHGGGGRVSKIVSGTGTKR